MKFDHDEMHRLLALLADSDIQEFRLEVKDFRLEVKRNSSSANQSPSQNSLSSRTESNQANQASSSLVVESALSEASKTTASPPPPAVPSSKGDSVEITSPMVGTFYTAPAPGEPSFAEIGSRVSVGQTVCIIEAMKLMNELESEVSGEIIEILVENGTPVEFGQPLMRLKPS
tara:strand:+ start:103 stop:621 length:519 start_codon:yes stop_codon:yes gene_type:complete